MMHRVKVIMMLCVMTVYAGAGRAFAEPPTPEASSTVYAIKAGQPAPVDGRLVPDPAWIALGQRMENAEASKGVPSLLVAVAVVVAVIGGGLVGYEVGRAK